MMRYLKVMVAVSAIFALAAIGVCGVEMFLVVREARNAVLGAAPQVKAQAAQIAGQAQLVLGSADASLRTLNKTLRTTNDAINQARDIERDNRADIKEINAQTVMSLEKFNALLVSVDASQKQAAGAIAQSSAALAPVMLQAETDLRELQPAIQQITPLLMRSTDIAVNLSNTTADVEREVHSLVYPPPRKWWQRYIVDPLKIGMHLVTIPLTNL